MRGNATRTPRPDPADRPDGAVDRVGADEGRTSFAGSGEARQLAATILEVLAGAQSPGEAARALGISVARYYQLEVRAVAGLVAACEDRRRKGRGQAPGSELAALRRECAQLRRECARQQALARATRRTVGLTAAPAPPPPPEGTPKRRKRRPIARALKMAALLHDDSSVQDEPAAATLAEETPSPTAPPAP
jgi:hypothetical protein